MFYNNHFHSNSFCLNKIMMEKEVDLTKNLEEFVNIELDNKNEAELSDSKVDSQRGTLRERLMPRAVLSSIWTLFRRRNSDSIGDIRSAQATPEKDNASRLESSLVPSEKDSSVPTLQPLRRDTIFDNSLTREAVLGNLIDQGNSRLQQGDYEEAAHFYMASLILYPEKEGQLHERMSSIYADLIAIDLDRDAYNVQKRKLKQQITEEKSKCQINLFDEKMLGFLSKLSKAQIKAIAIEFSYYANEVQRKFTNFKRLSDLKKHFPYTVIKFERIETVFGILAAAHVVDRSGQYVAIILPNFFIQSLNRSVIENYNKCLDCKKIKIVYKGKDKYGPKLAFKL